MLIFSYGIVAELLEAILQKHNRIILEIEQIKTQGNEVKQRLDEIAANQILRTHYADGNNKNNAENLHDQFPLRTVEELVEFDSQLTQDVDFLSNVVRIFEFLFFLICFNNLIKIILMM